MVIQHNISAMNANRILKETTRVYGKYVERLSSGYRVNRAADDAAGLSISEKMRRQIRGLIKGAENIQDGISLLQVADGALEEVHAMLHRMNELSIQAANGTNALSDRKAIQQEVDQLMTEIDRIGETTSFNEIKLFKNRLEKQDTTASQDNLSLHVKGMPTDFSIKDYRIEADANQGLTINGATVINWTAIQDQTGNALATQIQAGEYHFTYNGLDMSFEVQASDTLESLAKKLDGMKFQVDKHAPSSKVTNVTLNKQNGLSIEYVDDGDNYVDINKNGSCEVKATQDGISITNKNNGVTTDIFFQWDSYQNNPVYEDIFADGTANHIDFAFSDSQYLISVDLQPGWTKQDVIDAINGMTFDTNTTGNINEPVVDLKVPGVQGVSLRGVQSNFSKNFYQNRYGLDLTELDRHANWLTGDVYRDKIEITYQPGSPTTTLSLVNTTSQIDPTDPSSEIYKYRFADATDANNWMEISFLVDRNQVPPPDMNQVLDQSYIQSLAGHSMYQFANVQLPQNKPVDLTVNKQTGGNETGWIDQGIRIQCSADTKDFLMIHIGEMSAKKLGIHSISVETPELATQSIDLVAGAIEKISAQRANIGAYQNRLEHAVKINENVAENTQYAESRIRDTDMAETMIQYCNQQVLLSVGQAMLASANQNREMVLKLLQ